MAPFDKVDTAVQTLCSRIKSRKTSKLHRGRSILALKLFVCLFVFREILELSKDALSFVGVD